MATESFFSMAIGRQTECFFKLPGFASRGPGGGLDRGAGEEQYSPGIKPTPRRILR